MKKNLLILTVTVLMQLSVFARQYMICIEGQAYTFTYSNGTISNWATAGGCAFGPWLIGLKVDYDHENGTSDQLAGQLNDYLEVSGSGSPSVDQSNAVESLMTGVIPIVWLDPDELDSDVLDYLENGVSRFANPATQSNNNLKFVIKLYPDPAINEINLQVENGQSINSFEVINTLGQTMLKENCTTPGPVHSKRINIKSFPSGIYFLRIQDNNQNISKRFFKE